MYDVYRVSCDTCARNTIFFFVFVLLFICEIIFCHKNVVHFILHIDIFILYSGNLKNSGKVLSWLIDQKSKQHVHVNVFK